MLMHLKTIMWLIDTMKGNVAEAERYAEKACRMRDYCPDTAEWCAEMARRHLEFNNKGASVLEKHLTAFKGMAEGEASGALQMYVHDKRAWIAEETAEVHVKLEKYKA